MLQMTLYFPRYVFQKENIEKNQYFWADDQSRMKSKSQHIFSSSAANV